MKLQQMRTGQKFVTLPKELALALGWNKGDSIEFKVAGQNELRVRKISPSNV